MIVLCIKMNVDDFFTPTKNMHVVTNAQKYPKTHNIIIVMHEMHGISRKGCDSISSFHCQSKLVEAGTTPS